MNDFSTLETRLDTALARLAQGGGVSAEQAKKLASAEAQLADIKQENVNLAAAVEASKAEAGNLAAQLEKARSRVRGFKAVVESQKTEAEESEKAYASQISALETAQAETLAQRDKSREYSRQLKESAAELRSKNEEMVGDPDLINSGLALELAQLKEQRDFDLEEVNGILNRLTPLVEGN